MMTPTVDAIALLGPPGSGKGTQCRALGTLPDLHHFAMGDVLRALTADSTQAKQVSQAARAGELLPDTLIMAAYRHELDQRMENGSYDPSSQTLLLDGIPRTAEQAEQLGATVNVVGVIDLTCDDEQELRHRLFGRAEEQNRTDDQSAEVIGRRLDLFQQHHPDLLKYYGDRLAAIDAGRSPLAVLADVASELARML